jgi:hypothetical protein
MGLLNSLETRVRLYAMFVADVQDGIKVGWLLLNLDELFDFL